MSTDRDGMGSQDDVLREGKGKYEPVFRALSAPVERLEACQWAGRLSLVKCRQKRTYQSLSSYGVTTLLAVVPSPAAAAAAVVDAEARAYAACWALAGPVSNGPSRGPAAVRFGRYFFLGELVLGEGEAAGEEGAVEVGRGREEERMTT